MYMYIYDNNIITVYTVRVWCIIYFYTLYYIVIVHHLIKIHVDHDFFFYTNFISILLMTGIHTDTVYTYACILPLQAVMYYYKT